MKKRLTAILLVALMVMALMPTTALADGPYTEEEFSGTVQAFSSKTVIVMSSTTYQSGHQEKGGTVSDNANFLSTLRSQGSWTFTATPKDGYAFTGWTTGGGAAYSVSGNALTITYSGKSDYSATANFNFVGYTVAFAAGAHGSLSGTTSYSTLPYGAFPAVPTVNAELGYTHTGWSPGLPATVAASGNYTAQYTQNQYTISFAAGPGGTLSGTSTYNNKHYYDPFPAAPTPVPNDGYAFTGWSASFPATVSGSAAYTANFGFVGYNVNLNLGSGATFDSNGANTAALTGVQPGELSIPAYTVKDGYRFTGWSGTTNISGSTTLTAQYEYRVTFAGNAQVTITGTNPVWISGSSVTAPAYTVASGYRFDGWDRSLGGITGPTTITAKPAVARYTLTLEITGHGSYWDEDDVEGTHDSGAHVRLNEAWPVADIGWIHSGWLNNLTGETLSTGAEVDVTSNCSYSAIFESLGSRYVNAYAGANGKLNHIINGTYQQGTVINLNTALPAATTAGYEFKYWEEYIKTSDSWQRVSQNGAGEANVTVGVVNVYRAVFGLTNYTINYTLNGGTVSPANPAGYTAASAAITLTNPTRNGFNFAGWTGGGITSPTMNVTIPSGSTGDKTYTAHWTAINYSISYTLNGGTATPANPTSYTAESAAITLTNPTKDHYDFAGWTGGGITTPTLLVTIPAGSTGDKSYTANWTAKNYTISYTLNGGMVTPANPTGYTIESGVITLTNPTRNGFNFAGWTGGGISSPTMSVTIPTGSTGDKSYTANWTAISYSISYTLNGGTATPANLTGYTAENAAFTLNNPVKRGYDFAGWTGTDLTAPTLLVTIPAGSMGDRAYTANWTAVNYSISYTLNSGTVAVPNPTGYTIESGAITLNNPTRSNYDFAGWTGTDLTAPTLLVTITADSIGDRAYTANWTATNYSINYTLNGGTVIPVNPTGYTIESEAITLTIPTRDGFVFAGWTGTGLNALTISVTIPAGSAGDRAYTANWTAIDYTIGYTLDGGTAIPANPTGYTAESDAITLTNPTKLGYTFAGWTGSDINGSSTNVVIPTGSIGDRTYTATWTANNYTVTYDINNGDSGATADSSHTYDTASALTLSGFTRTGYTFAGWAESASGPKVYDDGALVSTLTDVDNGIVTLYAVWTANDYSVIYDINGGDGGATAGSSHTYDTASALTTNGFTKLGYTFTGWAQSAGGPKVYGDNENVSTLTAVDNGTVTLFAVWTANDYSVVYDINSGDGGATTGSSHTYDLDGVLTLNGFTKAGHTFAGWAASADGPVIYSDGQNVKNLTALDADTVTLFAKWTIDTFTVTFADYNGTTLKTQAVNWNTAATAPAIPTREGYTFTGWSSTFNAVKANMTVTAQYAINTYIVRFYAADGVTQIGTTQTVNWGTAAAFPAAPARTGSAFDTWVLTGDNAAEAENLTNVRENIVAVASYLLNGYTVTFVDFNGDVIGTDGVLYGRSATAPEVPARDGYAFAGWNGDFDNVTSDMTVTALYDINTYTVTFVDFDGTVISEDTVDWNTAADAPDDPARDGYTFTGWDTEFAAVTADMTVTAVYEENAVITPEALPQASEAPATVEDEDVPAQGPAAFPWWWILIGAGIAVLLFLLIFFLVKRRKKDEEPA